MFISPIFDIVERIRESVLLNIFVDFQERMTRNQNIIFDSFIFIINQFIEIKTQLIRIESHNILTSIFHEITSSF